MADSGFPVTGTARVHVLQAGYGSGSLGLAAVIIPGHGPAFRPDERTPR